MKIRKIMWWLIRESWYGPWHLPWPQGSIVSAPRLVNLTIAIRFQEASSLPLDLLQVAFVFGTLEQVVCDCYAAKVPLFAYLALAIIQYVRCLQAICTWSFLTTKMLCVTWSFAQTTRHCSQACHVMAQSSSGISLTMVTCSWRCERTATGCTRVTGHLMAGWCAPLATINVLVNN